MPNTVGYHNVAFAYGDPNESTEQKTNDAELVFRPAFPVPESLIQNLVSTILPVSYLPTCDFI